MLNWMTSVQISVYIVGALVAVPTAAVLNAIVNHLAGNDPDPDPPRRRRPVPVED